MMYSVRKICTVLLAALLAVSAGAIAAAPISTIAQGNTVFLGEEGLDITAAIGPSSQIGWWASAASIETSAPSYTMVVNPTDFFVSPTEFAGRQGPWYRLNGTRSAGVAFTVADPNLDIRVYDATLGVDATTNGWITSGSEAEFRITTNLYQIAQRSGVSFVPMQIHVQSPSGASYSALINKAGQTTSITAVPVTTSPYSTGPIWDTGRLDTYPSGTYAIWAECNVNSMKDNYAQVGKTYTATSGLLDQGRNPLIGVSTRTATPTTAVTRSPTTAPTTAPTTVPTTVVTAVVTTPPATLPPATVPVTTVPTKSPGFEGVLAGAALVLALAWSMRKD